MRVLGVVLILAIASTGLAQSALQLPQDAGKYHVSVCVNDASLPQEARYVRWFDEDPVLRKIKAQTFFHVYVASDPIFHANLAPALPCGCPAIIVQRNQERSGPLYAAGLHSRTAPLPASAGELAEKLVTAFDLEKGFQSRVSSSPLLPISSSTGQSVPGGQYYYGDCDECRRRHAQPAPLPLPLPAPGPLLIPNIETDVVSNLFPSTEPSSMNPLAIALGCTLVALIAIGCVIAGLAAIVWLWGVHKQRAFRRDLLKGAAILGAAGLVYQADQHKKKHHELFAKIIEVGAGVAGFTWLDALRAKNTGQPMLVQDAAAATGSAQLQAQAAQVASNLQAAAPDPTPLLNSLVTQLGGLTTRVDSLFAAPAAAAATVPAANPPPAAKAA